MATEEKYDQTFATGDHAELSLSNVRGQVQISGWDRPEMHVVAVKRQGSYWGAQQAFQETTIDVYQQDAKVVARTRSDRSFNPFGWLGVGTTPPEVDYTVQVPLNCDISVRIVGGTADVSGVQGAIYVRAVSGDVTLRQVSGNVLLTGVSGAVTVHEASGTLGARTVGGDIRVTKGRLTAFSGKTVSGDIRVESPLAPGSSYTARSVSGDFRLLVPGDTRATVELHSTSGHVTCELPCQISESRHGRWSGVVNGGGGATVSLHSVSGDVTLSPSGATGSQGMDAAEAREPGEPPATAPAATEGRESPEMAILRAVERGELSVDEAMQRLEDFGKEQ